VLCIEKCLLEKLPAIFSPEVVIRLDESVVQIIAAETEESKAERASSTKKLHILEATLKILHRLDRHKPRGKFSQSARAATEYFMLDFSAVTSSSPID